MDIIALLVLCVVFWVFAFFSIRESENNVSELIRVLFSKKNIPNFFSYFVFVCVALVSVDWLLGQKVLIWQYVVSSLLIATPFWVMGTAKKRRKRA